jgi:outer membrane scaffolding protein for murein synthesis (MipA/OmpV family)
MRSALAVFLICSICHQPVYADHQPLWEVHAGIGTLHVPHYRGSDSRHHYTVPFPSFIYRGEYIKAGEEGLKGLLYSSERISLDISMALGLPASSEGRDARTGMPDLKPTLEFGPSLIAQLWEAPNKQTGLWLNLPLRETFSFDDFDINGEGLIFSPYLQWRHKTGDWRFSASFGVSYADEDYHNYFYEVEPIYVTTNRPEYHPSGGYSGNRITLTATKRFKNSWIGAFIRYDTLTNAVFEDSPLVERDDYFAFGVAYTHILAKSQKTSIHSDLITENYMK